MMQANRFLTLLLTMLFFHAVSVDAQYDPYWQWAKADTASPLPVSNGASVLAVKGGKALWGRMTAVKRSTLTAEPQGNYTVTEYDSTGRQLNVTLIVGKVQLIDAQADAAGNWYVLGRFYDTLLFSGGMQLTRPNPAINTDADHFIVRFNAGSMTIGWVKLIGPLVTVSAKAFTLDNNALYVAADSLNTTVIRRMDFATGNSASLFRQNGISTTTSLQIDAQGAFYLAGTCASGGIDFNGATETANAPDRYNYIVKYNSSGRHVWHYWLRDNFCLTRKLTLYQNRFLYFTGDLRDSFTIGGKYLHPAVADFVAARLDTNGSVVWARQMDTSGGGRALLGDAYHAVVTPDTALVLFTEASGYLYWGDTFQTNLQTVTAATLVSYGPNNKPRWVRPVFAPYTTNQHIATEGLGVWVTGNANSPTGFVMMDTLKLKVPTSKYVPYLAKMKLVRPIPVNPPQGGVSGAAADPLRIYPVPVRTTLRVEGLRGPCQLTLSDISGRAVRSLSVPAGSDRALIDVADLPRGTYVLDMRTESERSARRIIVQ